MKNFISQFLGQECLFLTTTHLAQNALSAIVFRDDHSHEQIDNTAPFNMTLINGYKLM